MEPALVFYKSSYVETMLQCATREHERLLCRRPQFQLESDLIPSNAAQILRLPDWEDLHVIIPEVPYNAFNFPYWLKPA